MNSKTFIPAISILFLLLGQFGGISEGADVTLAWDPSPSSVEGYRLYQKTGTPGAPYTDSTTVGNVTTATVTGLVEGQTYYFAVTAYAGTLESTYSNEVRYTVPFSDTVPPTVTISNPTSASTYGTEISPITLAGTAADNIGITQITWSNARGGSGTCTGTTAWNCAGVALRDGANLITVTVWDAAGNSGTDTLSVTYTPPDTTAPTVTITSPTSGSTYNTGAAAITVAGTATDSIGVTSVAWANHRGGNGSCTGTTSWSCSGINLQSGTNIITVTARDAAGNQGTDTLTVTYTPPDTTAPAVAITSPTSGSTYNTGASTITVAGTASDAVGVATVAWANDRGGNGSCTGTTSWSCSGISLQSGSNIITVSVRDAAGNSGTDTLTVTYPLAPSANFSADVTEGEDPLTVQFTNLSTGTITSRIWDFGDGETSTVTNPQHVYSIPGIYTVTLTVYGPGGEHTRTVTDYLQVSPAPAGSLRMSSGS